jgi:ClpP class serine protease
MADARQSLGGMWSALPAFAASREAVAARVRGEKIRRAKPRPLFGAHEGIAQVELVGTTLAGGADWGFADPRDTADAFAALADDTSVRGVLFVVCCGGGSTAGVAELADAVAATAERKPVYGVVQDVAAGAGYWAACRCTKLFATNPTCVVGGIGAFASVLDSSKAFASAGIRPVLISSGGVKGAGTPGTVVTQDQIDNWKSLVDVEAAEFFKAVGVGRRIGMGRVPKDGAPYPAAKAADLGLLDGIERLDAVAAKLRAAVAMPKQTTTTNAITTTNHGEPTRVAAVADVKAPAPAAALVTEVKMSATTTSATERWNEAVAAAKGKGMAPAEATKAADKANPGLRAEMLREANAHRPKALATLVG